MMVANLAQQYVHAINCGTVPNIEHAWVYISKQECQKALEKALEMFQAALASVLLPLSDESFADSIHRVKQCATEMFEMRVRGMEVGESQTRLEVEIGRAAANFVAQNIHKFDQEFKKYAKEKAEEVR